MGLLRQTFPMSQVAKVLLLTFQGGIQQPEIDLHLHEGSDQVPPHSRLWWNKMLNLLPPPRQSRLQRLSKSLDVLRVTPTL
jgi:hypothetical protein